MTPLLKTMRIGRGTILSGALSTCRRLPNHKRLNSCVTYRRYSIKPVGFPMVFVLKVIVVLLLKTQKSEAR